MGILNIPCKGCGQFHCNSITGQEATSFVASPTSHPSTGAVSLGRSSHTQRAHLVIPYRAHTSPLLNAPPYSPHPTPAATKSKQCNEQELRNQEPRTSNRERATQARAERQAHSRFRHPVSSAARPPKQDTSYCICTPDRAGLRRHRGFKTRDCRLKMGG